MHKEGDFESEGEELERYNERDCRIVIEAMARLQKAADSMGFAVKPTPAGCSLDYIRRHMGAHLFLPSSEAFAPAYFGGRVMLLEPEYTGEGFCVDVNSLYPWAMSQSLPLGEPKVYRGPFNASDTRRLINECVGFARCRVKLHPRAVPPLPVLGKARIVYPTGEFDGLWAFPDLMSLDSDDKIWIRDAIVFREARPFLKEIIEHLYRLRKNTKNPAEKAALKILLNSSYGKFAEHKDKTDLSNEGDETVPVVSGGKVYLVGRNRKETEPPARSPAVAAYITAWSRRRWHELFNRYQEKCIYLDTDSAYLPGKPEEYPTLPVGDELGDLKVESRFNKFIGLAPKVYGYRYADTEKTKKGESLAGQWGVRAKGFPMGATFKVEGDTIYTDRAGVYPCDYKHDGGLFLQTIRSGANCVAKRPVSFALAGRQKVSPGTWVTLERRLSAGPASGRIYCEDWRRTVAPDASEVERKKWTGETFDIDGQDDLPDNGDSSGEGTG